jgi:hypothetical protein
MSNGRPWGSNETAQLRRLVAAGMTDVQIAVDMKRHANFIQAKRKELGIAPGMSRALRDMLARINMQRMQRRRATIA